MVEAYWLIGKRIVEEEQQGKNRAEYGQEIIKTLSVELQNEFGRGFGERILRDFRQFYLTFKDIEFGTQCVPNLSWSHFRLIMRLSDKNAMQYYLTEAAANNWSVRTLDRNISTLYYQRLLSSQKKNLVIAEMKEKTQDFQQDKLEFIKTRPSLSFSVFPITPAISRRKWKKPSSTIFSNSFLNWEKALPLCPDSSLYGRKQRNFILIWCFTILS
jgi:hypothetical protein